MTITTAQLNDLARAYGQALSLGLEWHVVGIEHDFQMLAVALDEWEARGHFSCDGFDLVPSAAKLWRPSELASRVLIIDEALVWSYRTEPVAIRPRAVVESTFRPPANLVLRALWIATSPPVAPRAPLSDMHVSIVIDSDRPTTLLRPVLTELNVADHIGRSGNGFRVSFGPRQHIDPMDVVRATIGNRTNDPIPYLVLTWVATRATFPLGALDRDHERVAREPSTAIRGHADNLAAMMGALQQLGLVADAELRQPDERAPGNAFLLRDDPPPDEEEK